MVEQEMLMRLLKHIDLENTNMGNESPSANFLFGMRPYNVQPRQYHTGSVPWDINECATYRRECPNAIKADA